MGDRLLTPLGIAWYGVAIVATKKQSGRAADRAQVRAEIVRQILGNLSRRELARRAGIHVSYLSRALRGERRLSADKLEAVAAAIKMPMPGLHTRLRALR